MAEDWPQVKARHTRRVSPWMAIIERDVEFAPGESEIYHAVSQQDYIAIVAALPDGRLPIVRQYRPALESFTWELPAGLIDPGEDAVACCRRGRVARSSPIWRARASGPCQRRLAEIAPEPTGHGLPLSKCEAYNRVYDQRSRSS